MTSKHKLYLQIIAISLPILVVIMAFNKHGSKEISPGKYTLLSVIYSSGSFEIRDLIKKSMLSDDKVTVSEMDTILNKIRPGDFKYVFEEGISRSKDLEENQNPENNENPIVDINHNHEDTYV